MKERIARLLGWTRALSAGIAPAPQPQPAIIPLPHTSASGPQPPAPECTCPPTPPPGAFVVDMRLGRLGQVVGHEGSRLRLRPPAGGPAWEVERDVVRAVTDAERLSAKVRVVNARGRWGK